ncbi:MAG: hypothetical protein WCD88_07240 [Desulfobacterales bacterium]
MKSKKTLFIHIGTNKTGTSAIQHSLSQKRKELSEKGVLYPNTGCIGDAHYEISRILGFDHGKPPAPEIEQIAFLDRFNAEIEASCCETCIISSEYFVLPRNAALVRAFFSDFNSRIIVYFRRHDHWWLSAYNQAVKTVVQPPWERGFQGYLNFNHKKSPQVGNYRAILDRWDKAFGRENILVRPYEKEQNQPNILSDFLTTIGHADLTEIFFNSDVPYVNHSLDSGSIFLLEVFQRMNVTPDIRRLLIDHVMKNAGLKDDESPIHPKIRRQLADEKTPLYKYIANTYLNRSDGLFFREPLPDPEAAWTNPAYPTIVEVANIVTQVITGSGKCRKPVFQL